MDSYEEYERKSKANEERNEEFLNLFSDYLEKAGLAEKTIKRHLDNARFYVDVYLDRAGTKTMEEGASEFFISDYLGSFFIRKCMWSTPAAIRSTSASLKKFYKCMLQNEKITKQQYDAVADTIKDEIETWQKDCAAYNDPEQVNPFMF